MAAQRQAKSIQARSRSGAWLSERYRLTCLTPESATVAATSGGSAASGIAVSKVPRSATGGFLPRMVALKLARLATHGFAPA